MRVRRAQSDGKRAFWRLLPANGRRALSGVHANLIHEGDAVLLEHVDSGLYARAAPFVMSDNDEQLALLSAVADAAWHLRRASSDASQRKLLDNDAVRIGRRDGFGEKDDSSIAGRWSLVVVATWNVFFF